jgi:hypothetical protein
VRVGRFLLPWVANGCLELDGRRHRLGGPRTQRETKVRAEPTACDFALRGPDVSIRGRVAASAEQLVAWPYSDPEGDGHYASNCSAASLELEVARAGGLALSLRLPAGAAYELGRRERPAGLEIQPFPDT